MILKTRIIAVFLLIIAVLVRLFNYYSEMQGSSVYKPFKLGLDLNGGTHLVYKADVSKVDPKDVNDL
jgi:preprotein translocase subunit SecD